MKGISNHLVIRKVLLFLIIDADLPIDCKLHKRCPGVAILGKSVQLQLYS